MKKSKTKRKTKENKNVNIVNNNTICFVITI